MSLIPMDQRDGLIWLDGELVAWRDAKIHVLTHGLHYASAVFEGERVYGGQGFELAAHGRRLLRSCGIMDMACPYGAPALDQAARAVIEANAVSEGYLRRIAWRGSEQLGVAAPETRIMWRSRSGRGRAISMPKAACGWRWRTGAGPPPTPRRCWRRRPASTASARSPSMPPSARGATMR
jgi:branched-subunit amino acid aminotransferase/4-amino-4-deoxychorismate lyase